MRVDGIKTRKSLMKEKKKKRFLIGVKSIKKYMSWFWHNDNNERIDYETRNW